MSMKNCLEIAKKTEIISSEKYNLFSSYLEHLTEEYLCEILATFIPGCLPKEEELVEDKIFSNYSDTLEVLFQDCCVLLTTNERVLSDDCTAVLLILIGGCDDDETTQWQVDKELCERLSKLLLKIHNQRSTATLLVAYTHSGVKNIAHRCFSRLVPLVKKETISLNPFARMSFSWILLQLEYPDMGEHMGLTLPFALNLCDDYRPEVKLRGLRCLRHIARHTLRAELRHQGHAEVHYDALRRLWYSRDPVLLESVYGTLLDLLTTVEQPPPCSRTEHQWSRYDDVADRLLTDLSIECSGEVKLALLQSLPRVLQLLGVSSVKHFSRILAAVENCLAGFENTPGLPVKMAAVDVLEQFVKLMTEDPAAGRAVSLLSGVLKVICAMFMEGSVNGTQVELVDRLRAVLECLARCYPQAAVGQLMEVNDHVTKQMQKCDNSKKVFTHLHEFMLTLKY